MDYRDAIKALPLKDIPSWFDIPDFYKTNGGPPRQSNFNDLLKKTIRDGKKMDDDDDIYDDDTRPPSVIKEILKGNVRKWRDYFDHIKSMLQVDKLVT